MEIKDIFKSDTENSSRHVIKHMPHFCPLIGHFFNYAVSKTSSPDRTEHCNETG